MKNAITPLAILAAVAAGVFFLRRKAAAGQNLQVDPVDIAIDSEATRASGFLRVYYTVKLKLINNERASVNVRSVSLSLSSQGTQLGTLTRSSSFVVPAMSEQIVSFNASIPTLGILSIIRNIIQNGINIPVNVSGFIDTDLGRISVNFTKTIGGQQSRMNGTDLTPIQRLKKGDIFKTTKNNVIYVYDGYNRSTKKYDAFRSDDINAFRSFKKDTPVLIDIDF